MVHKAQLTLELPMSLCGHWTAQFSSKGGMIHMNVPMAQMSTAKQVSLGILYIQW